MFLSGKIKAIYIRAKESFSMGWFIIILAYQLYEVKLATASKSGTAFKFLPFLNIWTGVSHDFFC